ncbi:hypothetical protein DB44_CD00010 [Candidatus Protochlamydia amoebophila]|uniref:Uncharacterized protein n=2 Tax=Candidatus Protochlamydia amoebophila TaxID=362787 RepID=A0A0C1JZK7_9BACT|nr:hypothetical protein DB44_CD00010 [Candidatus Protochlamydia amoebophila]
MFVSQNYNPCFLRINDEIEIDINSDWKVHNFWTVNEKKISLFMQEDQLKSKTCDVAGRKITTDVMKLQSIAEQISKKEFISYVFECKAALEDDDTITFSKPILTQTFGKKEITLLRRKKDFVWQLFYKKLKISIQVPVDRITCSRQCSMETVHKVRTVRERLSLEEQSKFFSKFFTVFNCSDHKELAKEMAVWQIIEEKEFESVKDAVIVNTAVGSILSLGSLLLFPSNAALFSLLATTRVALNSYHNFREYKNRIEIQRDRYSAEFTKIKEQLKNTKFIVEIEPYNAPSQLDERVRVSSFQWAVTLITYDGILNNHALICFEGITEGNYFAKIGHFNGSNVELIKNFKKVKFQTRSVIWMKQSEEVQKVIDIIDEEDRNRVVIPYSYCGESSIMGGNSNCLDWARKKLRLLDIQLEKSAFESLAALAKLYTKPPEHYLNEKVGVSL